MRAFLIQLVLVLALGWLLTLFLPWWSVAIAGFLGSFLIKSGYRASFGASFFGIFLLWSIAALLITLGTDSPLPDRMAELLPLPLDGIGLVFFSGLIGGLVAGIAGLAGRSFRGK